MFFVVEDNARALRVGWTGQSSDEQTRGRLHESDLGDEDAIQLAEALKTNTVLTTLM